MEAIETKAEAAGVKPPVLEIRESDCGRYHVFIHRLGGFSIEIPKSWEITGNLIGELGIKLLTKETDAPHPSNFVLMFDKFEKNYSKSIDALNDKVQSAVSDLAESRLALNQNERIEIAGRKWNVLTFENTLRVPGMELISGLKSKIYITADVKKAIVLQFTYVGSRLGGFQETMESMAGSFRMLE